MEKLKQKKIVLRVTFCMTLVLLMAVSFLLLFSNTNEVNAISGGDGTVSTPYEISTASDLIGISEDVNNGLFNGYFGVHFILTGDINLNDVPWMPIGTNQNPFRGTLNGNGYSIIGLFIDDSSLDRVGLFGFIDHNATIRNLTIAGSVRGNNFSAGLVGSNAGLIENVTNQVTVSAIDDASQIGGLAGYNSGTITNSSNHANIESNFVHFIGGIAGSNSGTIQNSYNIGNVTTINSIIGGIAGTNTIGGEISAAFNTGTITGNTVVGGIVGNNRALISNAYNRGFIDSENGTAGGIAGNNETVGSIEFVYSASNILGRFNIAAIAGLNHGIVSRAFFDRDLFNGELANAGVVLESLSLTTLQMVHSDTLTNITKLGLITNQNEGVWTKRAYNASHAFYPELRIFYENNIENSRISVSVERMELEYEDLTLSITSVTYNGQAHEPDVYFGELQLLKDLDFTVAFSDNVSAGQATAAITLINRFRGIVVLNFTIERAVLTIDFDSLNFVYNGALQHPIVNSVMGNIKGETITFTYLHTNPINAGTHQVEVVLANDAINQNYYLAETIITFEIAKATLSIEWAATNFVYNGQVQRPEIASVIGIINNEDVTFGFTFTGDGIRAGNHSITAYLEETAINANYVLEPNTREFQILQRAITIVWDTARLYYNGMAQRPFATITGGVIEGDQLTLVYSGYENNINANETDGHYVFLTLLNSGDNLNYFLEITHNYLIHRAPITIQWWETPLTFTGHPQHPGFFVSSGRIGNEEILFDISDFSNNINASSGGAYQITVSLMDNAINANYVFVPQTKTYDIGRAIFDVRTVEFRDTTFNHNGLPRKIFISSSLPIGVSVVYENNARIEVGAHTVTARFTVNLSNYFPLGVNFVTATLFIANTSFEFSDGTRYVELVDDVTFGTVIDLDTLNDNSHFRTSGKSILHSYELIQVAQVFSGEKAIRVSLSSRQLNRNGLIVLYRNASGDIVEADFEIVNGQVVFSATDLTDFAILAYRQLAWIWITAIIVVALALLAAAAFVLIKKREKVFAIFGSKKPVTVLPKTSECASDVGDADDKANTNDSVVAEEFSLDVLMTYGKLTIDGIKCESFESLLRGLNFRTISKQVEVCAGSSEASKLSESIPNNSVFWQGKRLRINSKAWQDFATKICKKAGFNGELTKTNCREIMQKAKELSK